MELDLLLISPPYWDFYSPFLALPSLSGFLRSKGFAVRQLDLNIVHFNRMIDKQGYAILKELQNNDVYDGLDTAYKNVFKANDAKEFTRKSAFIQPGQLSGQFLKKNFYQFTLDEINFLDGIFHYIYFNQLYKKNYWNKLMEFELDSIMEEVSSELLTDTLLGNECMTLIQQGLRLIGFSSTSFDQFIVSCIYARMIKRIHPEVKIVFGGSYIPVLMKTVRPDKQRKIFDLCDYIVNGEGETALELIIQHTSKGQGELADIPNLCFMDPSGQVVHNAAKFENFQQLPEPDFNDLDFELYLMPEIMLPYQSSRGCFWGHCTFCDHDANYRYNFRSKTAETVVENLAALKKKYNNQHIQFVDEAIKPEKLKEIVAEMEERELNSLDWMYYSRISGEYTDDLVQRAKALGCRLVLFGVETFNLRLIKMIRKGISEKNISKNLSMFSKFGIKNIIWMICGFPSQREEEIWYDIDKLKENSPNLKGVFAGLYRLERNCDMYSAPEKFNIIDSDPDNPYIFKSHYNGELIDQNQIFSLYKQEYAPLVSELSRSHNRYIIYFRQEEQDKSMERGLSK
ncbi:B12-binding domain-containing radical SAM protein [Paenibacillus graminis]|uniref:B12-binding domain-containing radical SAM protein n=2 Tax=Paenibacillus graminis TaxID=189425 RepID=UPI002DBA6535|nr:radical SAM protein [Paenibacillus graminis]MEC0170647.1 radical SAM protein [Paenibacillus graminis]